MDSSLKVIKDLVSQNLESLKDNPKYHKYKSALNEIRKPILKKISKDIKNSLKSFLSRVDEVKINIEDESEDDVPYISSSDINVQIDDGNLTDLRFKGDGIKSLVAISLIKQSISETNKNRGLILAIEEPEAHLHPKAIRRLNKILHELAKTQQVIIATHSPLLVDTNTLSNNIIVTENKALVAKGLTEIRKTLGVEPPDNLTSAELILFVEGESDLQIINELIRTRSKYLRQALDSNRLRIIKLGGITNLSSLSNLYKNVHIIKILLLADNDEGSNQAIKNAMDLGVMLSNEYMLAIRPDLKESEIEDIINYKIYLAEVLNKFGIDLQEKSFRNGKSKWSRRISQCFRVNGRPWNEDIEKEVKKIVCDAVKRDPDNALTPQSNKIVRNLITLLESRLKNE